MVARPGDGTEFVVTYVLESSRISKIFIAYGGERVRETNGCVRQGILLVNSSFFEKLSLSIYSIQRLESNDLVRE